MATVYGRIEVCLISECWVRYYRSAPIGGQGDCQSKAVIGVVTVCGNDALQSPGRVHKFIDRCVTGAIFIVKPARGADQQRKAICRQRDKTSPIDNVTAADVCADLFPDVTVMLIHTDHPGCRQKEIVLPGPDRDDGAVMGECDRVANFLPLAPVIGSPSGNQAIPSNW